MKQIIQPAKQLTEREVAAFLNEDPTLSQNGKVQWARTGIWRWESSDGLTYATSDGHTVEKARTACGKVADAAPNTD